MSTHTNPWDPGTTQGSVPVSMLPAPYLQEFQVQLGSRYTKIILDEAAKFAATRAGAIQVAASDKYPDEKRANARAFLEVVPEKLEHSGARIMGPLVPDRGAQTILPVVLIAAGVPWVVGFFTIYTDGFGQWNPVGNGYTTFGGMIRPYVGGETQGAPPPDDLAVAVSMVRPITSALRHLAGGLFQHAQTTRSVPVQAQAQAASWGSAGPAAPVPQQATQGFQGNRATMLNNIQNGQSQQRQAAPAAAPQPQAAPPATAGLGSPEGARMFLDRSNPGRFAQWYASLVQGVGEDATRTKVRDEFLVMAAGMLEDLQSKYSANLPGLWRELMKAAVQRGMLKHHCVGFDSTLTVRPDCTCPEPANGCKLQDVRKLADGQLDCTKHIVLPVN